MLVKVVVALFCVGLVAGEGTWQIVTPDVATIDAGVAFQSETLGYTAGTANGVGPEILITTDGATTWSVCNASFGVDILLLDVAASGNSALVTSVFGEMYSDDGGNTWGHSRGGGISQCARHFGAGKDGQKFGTAGQYDAQKFNGVGVSLDGGKTIKAYNANLFTEARYAAFPTDTTWYVTAGEWPQAPPPPPPPSVDIGVKPPVRTRPIRPRRSQLQDADGYYPSTYQPFNHLQLQDDGYAAQIAVTQDAGNTWTTVFAQNGTFYFNGIDCNPSNALNCCACAEGFGSTGAGARIYCTQDGGKTWNNTFFAPMTAKTQYSLMEIRFTTAMDAWAVGGEIGSIPNAWFLHSVDGGNTWTFHQKPIPGSMVLSLDMVDPNIGYAALDNTVLQKSEIAKYTSS